MKKEKFDVIGMSCSSCVAHVDKAVRSKDGVKDVNVNLLTNSMQVEFDENIIDSKVIIEAVKNSGYDAKIKDNKSNKIENENKAIENDEERNMKKRVVISFVFWIPLMYVAMHHMFYEWFGIPVPEFIKRILHGNENAITFCMVQLLLLIPIVYVNRKYFTNGFKMLFKKTPNMDSLVALGSSASIIYGIYAIFVIGHALGINDQDTVSKYLMDIYFESAGTILTLITVGKYLESKSKKKTTNAINKLINLAPKTATILDNNIETEVRAEDIKLNDIVIIKPGSSIPVDGKILEGNSYIDESAITGESIPVYKKENDSVTSGSINKNGYLIIRATKVGEDTTLSRIVKLVEEASNSKAPISKLADRISYFFVPTVIIIAIIAFCYWFFIASMSFEFSLSIGIAVLVISCPCALGLATPVAIMVATGKGAQNGILIKSAENLEILHEVDVVVFDKTGTITEGKPEVTDIVLNKNIKDIDTNTFIQILYSLENKSEHPLAIAIKNRAKKEMITVKDVDNFKAESGKGIKGRVDGIDYISGNRSFIFENEIELEDFININEVEMLISQGKTCIFLANNKEILGACLISDTIKPDSKIAVEELQKRKIETIMITGDNKNSASYIAKEAKINKVISEVLPEDKEIEVSKLQKEGKKVAFVGDGINDSPALTKADVGLAIGNGTDIAIESADIILVRNSLIDVVNAIDLSKSTINNIKMNLFWAFFYNIIGIPIACGILYNRFGIKLNPMIGALAMSMSSICVVTNALRLRKFKPKVIIKKEEKSNNMEKIIDIEGMQCNHCKMTVEKALKTIEEIKQVDVSLEDKSAKVILNQDIEEQRLREVIEKEGFEVKNIRKA